MKTYSKFTSVFLILIAVFVIVADTSSAEIMDSFNTEGTMLDMALGLSEVGWLYTPDFSYSLTGVLTKFGSGDSRTITLEVYDEPPLLGGTILRSGTFSPVAHTFTGDSFAPLELIAGEDYFVGFRNTKDLFINMAVSGIELPFYGGVDNDGTYPIFYDVGYSIGNHAILQFEGVPEPCTLVLLGLGGLLLRQRER